LLLTLHPWEKVRKLRPKLPSTLVS
jgi:hypothetical protein